MTTPCVLPTVPAPSEPGLLAPRQLIGTARHGLRVSSEQISRRFPVLPATVVQRIQQLLQNTVAETFTRRDAADWGLAAQLRYGALVEMTLQLAQQPLVQTAEVELRRLYDLLSEVDEDIGQHLEPGLLARWRAADPWRLLQRHEPEIDQLRAALSQAVPALMAQAEALDRQHQSMRALAGEIEALGFSATLLAELLPSGLAERASLDQALAARAIDLAQTHAHVIADDPLRKAAGTHVAALADAIRQAVLLLLPGWLEKAMHARRRSTTPTPTLARRLQHELEAVLRVLRPG